MYVHMLSEARCQANRGINAERFQIVAHKDSKLELRINPVNGYSKEDVFELACTALKMFLASHGVHFVEIFLSKEEPKQHPQSGKFKHVINAG